MEHVRLTGYGCLLTEVKGDPVALSGHILDRGVEVWKRGRYVHGQGGRCFRVVAIDPARILGAIHATWTVEDA